MSTKAAIRAEVRRSREVRRAERDATAHLALTEQFATQLARLTRASGAQTVACFVGVRGEPDTSGFLDWALANGVRVLLPRSLPDGTLEWVASSGELVAGAFGIPEPAGDPVSAAELGDVDLVLAPAAAVDHSGVRLGWGRGYYDRALAGPLAAAPCYAVVFADELRAQLPHEAHDVPVQGAVTEETVHRFG